MARHTFGNRVYENMSFEEAEQQENLIPKPRPKNEIIDSITSLEDIKKYLKGELI